jgi:hypothetical protein
MDAGGFMVLSWDDLIGLLAGFGQELNLAQNATPDEIRAQAIAFIDDRKPDTIL